MARKASRNGKNGNGQGWFEWFACVVAHLAGKPATFLLATLFIVVWAVSGPFFDYSDTWQLAVNTGTTIMTFLMVFLIQNTQNRDTMALQIKLAELIIRMRGAKNDVALAEDMTEEDLEKLHKQYRKHADATLDHLREKRDAKSKASRRKKAANHKKAA